MKLETIQQLHETVAPDPNMFSRLMAATLTHSIPSKYARQLEYKKRGDNVVVQTKDGSDLPGSVGQIDKYIRDKFSFLDVDEVVAYLVSMGLTKIKPQRRTPSFSQYD